MKYLVTIHVYDENGKRFGREFNIEADRLDVNADILQFKVLGMELVDPNNSVRINCTGRKVTTSCLGNFVEDAELPRNKK
jgi:hypothetical protein